jgi:hypothetical protein
MVAIIWGEDSKPYGKITKLNCACQLERNIETLERKVVERKRG